MNNKAKSFIYTAIETLQKGLLDIEERATTTCNGYPIQYCPNKHLENSIKFFEEDKNTIFQPNHAVIIAKDELIRRKMYGIKIIEVQDVAED